MSYTDCCVYVCAACGQPIQGATYALLNGRQYHNHCVSLVGQLYPTIEDRIANLERRVAEPDAQEMER